MGDGDFDGLRIGCVSRAHICAGRTLPVAYLRQRHVNRLANASSNVAPSPHNATAVNTTPSTDNRAPIHPPVAPPTDLQEKWSGSFAAGDLCCLAGEFARVSGVAVDGQTKEESCKQDRDQESLHFRNLLKVSALRKPR